jgi:diguanylate cyclase (GGDEF)-like protein
VKTGDLRTDLLPMTTMTSSPAAQSTLQRRRVRNALARVRSALPVGLGLSEELWQRRHAGIVACVAAHIPVLLAIGLFAGKSLPHMVIDMFPIAACVGAAMATRTRCRMTSSGAATLGLVSCSAMLVHLTGGTTEMHFHFFVVVGVITLYQDWVPFGLALTFVVLHHGVMGVLAPDEVYSHGAARANPWLWAGIHGAFVLAASVAHVLSWRLNEDQALRDSLTRMPNRALFADQLRLAIARRARHNTSVAVLFIDLDGFKAVNDTKGHHAGDRLLVEVAARINASIRQVDTAARFGGDEFAVLLDDVDAEAALVVAQRLLNELTRPIALDDGEAHISASIGLVTVDREASTDEILRNADLAMYTAKAAGGRQVEVFAAGLSNPVVENAGIENDLRAALAAGDIEVYYQPTVELDTGVITGMEALARWTHAERGYVPPGVFIPVAEATGMVVELGRRVLNVACADGALWHAEHPHLSVAVNVSVRQIGHPEFVEHVATALRTSGMRPDALVLEITESVLAQDVKETAARLVELKALGVRLAIDDFGTGYSSLSYLRHFPIDILKIDRSFVEQLPGDGSALARSIVRLGESLHLEVVAEGVEDDAQRGALTSLGCHHGQGFLFAKAEPSSVIDVLLDSSQIRSGWWREAGPDVPAQRGAAEVREPSPRS